MFWGVGWASWALALLGLCGCALGVLRCQWFSVFVRMLYLRWDSLLKTFFGGEEVLEEGDEGVMFCD